MQVQTVELSPTGQQMLTLSDAVKHLNTFNEGYWEVAGDVEFQTFDTVYLYHNKSLIFEGSHMAIHLLLNLLVDNC